MTPSRLIAHVSALTSAATLALGCSQASPPPEPVGPGEATGTPPGAASTAPSGGDMAASGPSASHFPMDAATWVYRHTDATGGGWEETVTSMAVDFQGRAAFMMNDNENTAGERGDTVHVREGGRVLRVHQDVYLNGAIAFRVDYDPGFLRWDDTWAQATGSMDWSYTRTETDPLGAQVVAQRLFHYTILSTSEEVTVTAGTFDCVHVERVRDDTLETNEYWFAEGVGKVKEFNVTSGGSEELVSYALP